MGGVEEEEEKGEEMMMIRMMNMMIMERVRERERERERERGSNIFCQLWINYNLNRNDFISEISFVPMDQLIDAILRFNWGNNSSHCLHNKKKRERERKRI